MAALVTIAVAVLWIASSSSYIVTRRLGRRLEAVGERLTGYATQMDTRFDHLMESFDRVEFELGGIGRLDESLPPRAGQP